MFGLGRVSTQNTLASVESDSTFTPRVCVDQPGPQPALQPEAAPGTSGLGLLTTITERRSTATSRSTSHIGTPVPTLAASQAGEEPLEGHGLPKDTAQGRPEERPPHTQVATLRRLRTIGRRFKERFYAKPSEWKLSRIRLRMTKAMEPSHDAPEPLAMPSAGPILSDDHRTALTGDISASASVSGSTTEVSSGQERSTNVEEPVNETGEDPEDRHASLRARRRELTLAREREIAANQKCQCSPECPCINGSHVTQGERSDTPENIHVPHYLFPNHHSSTGSSNSQPSHTSAQGLDFSHMGGHFDSPRRSSSADESSSAAESGPRRTRFSQGSILWSNGSSSSLRARRPLVGRASSLPVGNRTQYFPGLRTGSHSNSLTPSSGWPEIARAPGSVDERNIPGRTSRTASFRNGEVSLHQSSTSLANLPDPQEEEQLVDGVSPTSHSPMRDGDEMPQTPQSGIRSDGDVDAVLALAPHRLPRTVQDLADGEIPDHNVHLPEHPANNFV